MKLVKEISTEEYKIISDSTYLLNPTNYIDRSNNPWYIEEYVERLSDVVLAKDMLKNLYTTNGWSSFKPVEKKSVARLMAYSLPQIELDEALTTSEQSEAKLKYLSASLISRSTRWEHLRQSLALYVTEAQSLGFYTDTEQFKGKYIDAGLPHLVLWLTNGSYVPLGIDYTLSGFEQASYYTVEMKQMCIDYLVTGTQYEVA